MLSNRTEQFAGRGEEKLDGKDVLENNLLKISPYFVFFRKTACFNLLSKI